MTGKPPEGWYADPQSRAAGEERWWNGHQWTAHTRTVAPPEPAEPAAAEGPGQAGAPGPAAVAQTLRPAAALPDGSPIAEVGERVGAYVIDVVVVFVLGSILSAVVGVPLWLLLDAAPPGFSWVGFGDLVDATVIGATWLGYQLSFRASGTTFGKRLLRLRVRPLAADGPLTTGQVLRRSVIGSGGIVCTMFPGAPVFGLGLIGYEAYRMSKHPLGPSWHDQVAGTAVIRTPRL